MAINDNYIKEKISLYKKNLDINIFEEIKNHVSHYIYNYPRKVFHCNHESSTEFYIYYMERLEKKIISYKENDARFVTWFTYTLRSSYINFINFINNKNKYKFTEISLDAPLYEGEEKITLHEKIGVITDKKSGKNFITAISKEIARKYKRPDELIFKMHYLEIFITVIIPALMEYFKLNFNDAYQICENARNTYIKKYDLIMKLEDSLSMITLKIIEAEKNSDEKELKNLRAKKAKQIERINAIRVVVPYKTLSAIFKISANAVNKIINKIKNMIKLDFRKTEF